MFGAGSFFTYIRADYVGSTDLPRAVASGKDSPAAHQMRLTGKSRAVQAQGWGRAAGVWAGASCEGSAGQGQSHCPRNPEGAKIWVFIFCVMGYLWECVLGSVVETPEDKMSRQGLREGAGSSKPPSSPAPDPDASPSAGARGCPRPTGLSPASLPRRVRNQPCSAQAPELNCLQSRSEQNHGRETRRLWVRVGAALPTALVLTSSARWLPVGTRWASAAGAGRAAEAGGVLGQQRG